ncbi:MAG: DUF72 domain-containing protein [Spirochaetales bacterium]|nr:DUF72 domain-containing protein [Spirochaetales bacterium]
MLRIGTSSWNYDSWEGLVYDRSSAASYLEQYARVYDTAEIDRWFWSLFDSPEPRLPDTQTAEEYFRSVPEGFLFTIKVPNSITLTHHYRKDKSKPLKANPLFLSPELYGAFLQRLEPLQKRIGALIFQFEYLNRQKMSSQKEFQSRMESFFSSIRRPFPCTVETRNPRYLNDSYFQFLRANELYPCFLQGYYMPDLRSILPGREGWFREGDLTIIRLHGPDRQGMEKMSGKQWDRIVSAKDQEIADILDTIGRLLRRRVDVYLNVNNHYEGSAPLTIRKIRERLDRPRTPLIE